MSIAHEQIQLQLDALSKNGACFFDPVQFSYIESLIRRATGKPKPVQRALEIKATKALATYLENLNAAQKNAQENVNQITLLFPDLADQAQLLYDKYDFKGILEFKNKLEHQQPPPPLASITNHLNSEKFELKAPAAAQTLDDLLDHQENEVLQSLNINRSSIASKTKNNQGALKSFCLLKKTLSKHYSRRVVTHAIKKQPENPGPLNTDMLTTHSLRIIRDIAPNYLNRIVTFIDTLLWLEQADKDLNMSQKITVTQN